MLYGIGCDLCEVARMEKSLSGAHGPAFVRRVFGPAEQADFTGVYGKFVTAAAGRCAPVNGGPTSVTLLRRERL